MEQNGKRIVANSAKGKSMFLFLLFFSPHDYPSVRQLWAASRTLRLTDPDSKAVWGLQLARTPTSEASFQAKKVPQKLQTSHISSVGSTLKIPPFGFTSHCLLSGLKELCKYKLLQFFSHPLCFPFTPLPRPPRNPAPFLHIPLFWLLRLHLVWTTWQSLAFPLVVPSLSGVEGEMMKAIYKEP